MIEWPTYEQWLELSFHLKVAWLIFYMVVYTDYSAWWVNLYVWWTSL